MLKLEGTLEIKILNQQGYSIRQIAKKLGISRNTVRKALRQEGEPQYHRAGVNSILDPYKNYLQTKLSEADFTSSRLCREIKVMGYSGSCSLVREYVRTIRVKKDEDATIRFETLPGQQAQVDWDPFGLIKFSDYPKAKYVSRFSMVLGYSRYMNVLFYFSRDIESFFNAHIQSFEKFGGVPKEILYDQVKVVVIEDYGSGEIKWNSTFLDFAKYYGFRPLLCKKRRAQTKGKVERPHRYIYQDFFLGREFKNLDDMNNQCREWLDKVANIRTHSTTKEIPALRLEQEKKYFILLPQNKYNYIKELPCKSSKDCYVSYGGNLYSVPDWYPRKELSIKIESGQIYIYQGQQLISEHKLSSGKGQKITNPDHFKRIQQKTNNIELQRIYGEFSYLGEVAKNYLAGLKTAKVDHLTWQVKKILELVIHTGKKMYYQQWQEQ